MSLTKSSLLFAASLLLVACNDSGTASNSEDEAPEITYGSLTDTRDGKTYKTVMIGNQEWMAENLNYAENGHCYEGLAENCEKYGHLYSWTDAQTICPEGFHLPSKAEWNEMIEFVGGSEIAGKKLKSSSGWDKAKEYLSTGTKVSDGNGTNFYGFNVLPAGECAFDGTCYGENYSATFWSTEKNSGTMGSYWYFNTFNSIRYEEGSSGDYIGNWHNVRCMKD